MRLPFRSPSANTRPLTLSFTRAALKDLRCLAGADRARGPDRLEADAADPAAPGHDGVPILGVTDGYRLRFREWRALFTIAGAAMDVDRIRHRREAYR